MATIYCSTSAQILDVESTSEGITIPRMTEAQRNAIGSPTVGELIYQTNGTPGFYYYNGSAWTALTGGSGGSSISVLHGGSAINGPNIVRYGGIANSNRSVQSQAEFIVTRSGTLKNFFISFSEVVAATSSITVSVLVDNVSVFSHAMVTGDGLDYGDIVTTAGVSQGDRVVVKFESNGVDPTTGFIYMTCSFELE